MFDGLRFVHRPHLDDAGLDCDSCHDPDRHGERVVTVAVCMECHEPGDDIACATCHVSQKDMFTGLSDGDIEESPSWMVDLTCDECHGEPHESADRASVLETCVDCHEDGYDEMVDEWQADTESRLAAINGRLSDFRTHKRRAVAAQIPVSALEQAERLVGAATAFIDRVRSDRSRGVHNIEFTELLLADADDRLQQAISLLADRMP